MDNNTQGLNDTIEFLLTYVERFLTKVSHFEWISVVEFLNKLLPDINSIYLPVLVTFYSAIFALLLPFGRQTVSGFSEKFESDFVLEMFLNYKTVVKMPKILLINLFLVVIMAYFQNENINDPNLKLIVNLGNILLLMLFFYVLYSVKEYLKAIDIFSSTKSINKIILEKIKNEIK